MGSSAPWSSSTSFQAADIDQDGISVAVDAIDLDNGSIRDTTGNDLVADLGDHVIENDDGHKVDGSLERAPRVAQVSFDTTPQNGHTYYAGERVEVMVNFSEDVVLAPAYWTGQLKLQLTIGDHTRDARVFWHDGGRSVFFHYEVGTNDLDDDGMSVAANALMLNGTTIQDRDGNAVDLDLGRFAIADDPGHKVDGRVTNTSPAVRWVTFWGSPAGGETYSAGEAIQVGVSFDKGVDIRGDVRLRLVVGDEHREAKPLGRGTCIEDYCRSISFDYLVQEGDVDVDGISIAADALTSHGGWIRDRYGNDAKLGLGASAIENAPGRKVDGSVDSPPRLRYAPSLGLVTDGTAFKAGELISLYVVLTEPVVVEGPLMMKLDVGGTARLATYRYAELYGAAWQYLFFEYRVLADDPHNGTLGFPGDAVELVGGSVKDLGGNAPDLSLANVPTFGAAFPPVNTAADDQGPAVNRVEVLASRRGEPVPAGSALRQNDALLIRVGFDEYFELDDAATLSLGIGDETVEVPSRSLNTGPLGRYIAFTHVVRPADSGVLAIARDALTLEPNAAVRDGRGNAADLDLGEHAVVAGASYTVTPEASDSGPAVRNAFVSVSRRHLYPGGLGEGARLRLVVEFDEPVVVDTTGGSPLLHLRLGTQLRAFRFAGYDDLIAHRAVLVFDYYMRPSDFSVNWGDPRVALNGATIKDAAGNDAVLEFPAGSFAFSARVDGSLPAPDRPRAESKAIYFSELSSERGPDRSFGQDEVIDIPVFFSEPVEVEGTPSLPFLVGEESRDATYIGGSGSRKLLFRYRVTASDLGPIDLPRTEVQLHGGRIRGLDGDDATLAVEAFQQITHWYLYVNGSRRADAEAPFRDGRLGREVTQALGNPVGTPVTLAQLSGLTVLEARNVGISNLAGLDLAEGLEALDVAGNAISDVAALAGLTELDRLDLSSNNAIRDISPLLSNTGLGEGDELYLQGNPLSAEAIDMHVPALRARGVVVYLFDVRVTVASVVEGGSLEFGVHLSSSLSEDVELAWEAVSAASDTATYGEDYPAGQSGTVVVRAGDTSATVTVLTNGDGLEEPNETLRLNVAETAEGLPEGVALVEPGASGLIVDPDGDTAHVPVFATAAHATRQGFARIVNGGGSGVVHIDAIDEMGNRRSTSLAVAAGHTVYFNSDDLERGNLRKGLSRGVGSANSNADWRLELRGTDVEVLSYMRTRDGFLTSLHDRVPEEADEYRVPIFNPGSNLSQVSWLRLINAGQVDSAVTIVGTDDAGVPSGTVELELAAGETRTVSAAELESGTGLEGALGDGAGKWELVIQSEQPIAVGSLLESPIGHLTNLSTRPNNMDVGEDETTHHVPLFPSASDPDARQGFVRVVNRGVAGGVRIVAYDESELSYDPVMLQIGAGQAVHLNSDDLELGNAAKGLPLGVGSGSGSWRLELSSALDLDVLAYVRRTEDGFLTSIHDTVPLVDDVYSVPIFNPGRNRTQVSRLRLVNPGANSAEVRIRGVDDLGTGSGEVRLTLPGGTAVMPSAQDLESGAPAFTGALGPGTGKWRLEVESDQSDSGHEPDGESWRTSDQSVDQGRVGSSTSRRKTTHLGATLDQPKYREA